jgi:hypothetical protein
MKALFAILLMSVLVCYAGCKNEVYLLASADNNSETQLSSKINSKSNPSIFQAWSGIENKPNEDKITRLSRHNLAFGHPYTLLELSWDISENQPYQGLATKLNRNQLLSAKQRKQQLLSYNPNILLLVEIRYRDATFRSVENEGLTNWWEVGFYPKDSPYWLRDENNKPVIGWGEDSNYDGKIDEQDEVLNFLIDFTNREIHHLIAEKALSLKNTGLFDGIMLDWWSEDFATSPIGVDDWSETILSWDEELKARIALLQKIRAQVGDDFLILVNANSREIPQSAPYVNGLFMESYKAEYNRGYTRDEIVQLESTLLWAEQNLKIPRINCLEGWRVVTDYGSDENTRIAERNSPENRQWMRLITTLSLTHSDGYVLFGDDNAIPVSDHLHNWYDFWDADLGKPIGAKAQKYNNIEGLFVREFENGFAVYNRSGCRQTIAFSPEVIGVDSDKRNLSHQVADFDGEIFLK